MRLRIATPLAVVVDTDDVVSLRATDASGGFGVLSGHADFLTALTIGVVGWHGRNGVPKYCAVRRGVFTVSGGEDIAIATREAVTGNDLATLDQDVLARFRADVETERAERVDLTKLQLNAIRRIVSQLRQPGRGGSADFA